MTTRRLFLKGVVALSAAGLAGVKLDDVPVIAGDGLHDDTAGVQALIDGNPFRTKGSATVMRRDGVAYFKGGEYKLTDTITMTEDTVNVIAGSKQSLPTFLIRHFGAGFRITGGQHTFSNISVETPPNWITPENGRFL